MSRWGLHKNLSHLIMYDVKDDRLVFPLRDENGTLIDAIGRSLVGGHRNGYVIVVGQTNTCNIWKEKESNHS